MLTFNTVQRRPERARAAQCRTGKRPERRSGHGQDDLETSSHPMITSSLNAARGRPGRPAGPGPPGAGAGERCAGAAAGIRSAAGGTTAEAVALQALLAGQDVEPAEGSDGTDRRWQIAQSLAEDQVARAADRDARHARRPRTQRPATATGPMCHPSPRPESSPTADLRRLVTPPTTPRAARGRRHRSRRARGQGRRARGRRCRPPYRCRRGTTPTLSRQSRSRAHRGAQRDLICKAGNQPIFPPPLLGHQAPGVPDEPITICD
jgi:hypothetical protein